MSPPRNISPVVISSQQTNGSATPKPQQQLGGQPQQQHPVSVEVRPRGVEHLSIGSMTSGGVPSSMSSTTTILAVPNLSHQASSTSQLQQPLTAINLSANQNNNHVANGGGVLNATSSPGMVTVTSGQQIFTSMSASPFVTSANPQSHVIMKGGVTGMATTNNIGLNKGGNGLIIKEATGPVTSSPSHLEPPSKMVKLVNGNGGVSDLTSMASLNQHTQVLPIYSSTQNGGLRVIGHHTTTTSMNGSNLPPSVVFSDSKYQQHLPSGMVISANLGGSLPHQYMTSTSTAGGAPIHKLLLTGMPPNMMAQTVSSAYLPQVSSHGAQDMFPRISTSLPGGAQLNLCRSPSSTPSPTISITASSNKGQGGQKGKRAFHYYIFRIEDSRSDFPCRWSSPDQQQHDLAPDILLRVINGSSIKWQGRRKQRGCIKGCRVHHLEQRRGSSGKCVESSAVYALSDDLAGVNAPSGSGVVGDQCRKSAGTGGDETASPGKG